VNRLGKSFFVSGYSDLFKKIGEAPSILDTTRVRKSEKDYTNIILIEVF